MNFRFHAAWDITDDTSVLASVHYTDEEQGTAENVPSGVLDLDSIDSFGLTEALDPGTGFWPNNQNTLSHDRQEFTDTRRRGRVADGSPRTCVRGTRESAGGRSRACP